MGPGDAGIAAVNRRVLRLRARAFGARDGVRAALCAGLSPHRVPGSFRSPARILELEQHPLVQGGVARPHDAVRPIGRGAGRRRRRRRRGCRPDCRRGALCVHEHVWPASAQSCRLVRWRRRRRPPQPAPSASCGGARPRLRPAPRRPPARRLRRSRPWRPLVPSACSRLVVFLRPRLMRPRGGRSSQPVTRRLVLVRRTWPKWRAALPLPPALWHAIPHPRGAQQPRRQRLWQRRGGQRAV